MVQVVNGPGSLLTHQLHITLGLATRKLPYRRVVGLKNAPHIFEAGSVPIGSWEGANGGQGGKHAASVSRAITEQQAGEE